MSHSGFFGVGSSGGGGLEGPLGMERNLRDSDQVGELGADC